MMENNIIQIRKTKTTPSITLNKELSLASIVGESCPENAPDFFRPLLFFVDDCVKTNNKIHLEFDLDYFNTSSAKTFIDLFDLLEMYYSSGTDCYVKWICRNNDYDLIEAGEDLLRNLMFKYDIISE